MQYHRREIIDGYRKRQDTSRKGSGTEADARNDRAVASQNANATAVVRIIKKNPEIIVCK